MAPQFDVKKIHTHGPGWEEEWGRLTCFLMYGSDPEGNIESGPLYKTVYRLLLGYNAQNQTEGAVSYIWEEYQKRVSSQTLFLNFDMENGDPVKFLCYRKYLRLFILSFYNNEMCNVPDVSGKPSGTVAGSNTKVTEDGEEVDLIDNLADKKADDPQERAMAEEENPLDNGEYYLFELDFQELHVNFKKPSGAIYILAGLNLYQNLSNDRDMLQLRKDARECVADKKQKSVSQAKVLILSHLNQDRNELNHKIEELRYKQKADMYRNEQNRANDSLEFVKTVVEYIFVPLQIKSLMDLLNLTPDTAAQQRSRYRRMLPKISDAYKKFDDHFDDL